MCADNGERERDVEDTRLDRIANLCREAHGIAWDECHKVYILMDAEQVEMMRGYPVLVTRYEAEGYAMAGMVLDWYSRSCGLRFISAVTTDRDDPNAGFEQVVPQMFVADDGSLVGPDDEPVLLALSGD